MALDLDDLMFNKCCAPMGHGQLWLFGFEEILSGSRAVQGVCFGHRYFFGFLMHVEGQTKITSVIHRINKMLPQNPAVVSLEYFPIQESSAMDNVPWLWFADSNVFSKTQRWPGVTPAAFCSVPAKPKRFGSFAWDSGEVFGTSSFCFSQTHNRAKPHVFNYVILLW